MTYRKAALLSHLRERQRSGDVGREIYEQNELSESGFNVVVNSINKAL